VQSPTAYARVSDQSTLLRHYHRSYMRDAGKAKQNLPNRKDYGLGLSILYMTILCYKSANLSRHAHAISIIFLLLFANGYM